MLRKIFSGIILAAGCMSTLLAENTPIEWKFPNATAEWSKHFNAQLVENEDSVTLIPRKADHGIINPKIDIDPAVYNCLRVTYLAEGFKRHQTTGDLFFTTSTAKRYSADNRVKLPSLIPDGKVRTFSLRLDTPQWLNGGKITSLRLDITDQIPGDVKIFKIELLARNTAVIDGVWDFKNGAGSWDMTEKLDAAPENGELKLITKGIDSHLFNYFDRIDGSKYSQLRITYRAADFKGRTTGGLFYMVKGNRQFSAKQFIRFPGLICDGKEHSFTVKVKMPKDITALRLDIVDQFPGTVWLKKIEFLP